MGWLDAATGPRWTLQQQVQRQIWALTKTVVMWVKQITCTTYRPLRKLRSCLPQWLHWAQLQVHWPLTSWTWWCCSFDKETMQTKEGQERAKKEVWGEEHGYGDWQELMFLDSIWYSIQYIAQLLDFHDDQHKTENRTFGEPHAIQTWEITSLLHCKWERWGQTRGQCMQEMPEGRDKQDQQGWALTQKNKVSDPFISSGSLV